MKVVFATNVLLVSIPTRSKYHPIIEALADYKYRLLLSNDIYLEYLEIIAAKSNPSVVEGIINFIYKQGNIEIIDVHFQWNLISVDWDENKFCDCAIAGNADYIVTNDAHFNVLKNLDFPKLKVITAEEFLNVLEGLS
ncbi:MAG: putative toxin-antitoxin system toxin component, PIN family [Flavisolibacter sp.]|nr:putative toxin-antitoxin system toxin component, PIN family [Flavisolibacter sp.]